MRRALGLVLVVGASALRPPTSPLRPPTRAQRALGARAPPEALPRQRRRAKLWPFVSSACALGTRPLRARAMNLAVSLDQPLVKSRGGLSALARAASGALVPLLALALTLRLVRTVARALIDDEYYDDEDDEEVEEEEEEYDDAEEDEGGSLGLGSFSLRGFLANTVAGVRAVFDELFPLDVEWLPETEWTTVSLAGSTDLGAGFMRYRFTYPSGEDQMPLEVSEMCFRSLRGQTAAGARAQHPKLRSRCPPRAARRARRSPSRSRFGGSRATSTAGPTTCRSRRAKRAAISKSSRARRSGWHAWPRRETARPTTPASSTSSRTWRSARRSWRSPGAQSLRTWAVTKSRIFAASSPRCAQRCSPFGYQTRDSPRARTSWGPCPRCSWPAKFCPNGADRRWRMSKCSG